jgi:class 3 adenylate cyclase/tetratricopeptide (TPR) repeat protein
MSTTVSEWLARLGLGVYAEAFAENDVDMRALPLLSEADLRELGASLGHRKVLLAAIAELGADATAAATDPAEHAPAMPKDQAEHRLLSVLFADIVGSTALSQRFGAEEMREALRGFQDAVSGAVSRYGGYVAKYLGDGALAYFGWPMAYEDHAERALLAGLEIVSALGGVRLEDGACLAGRVGIATGRVVVGDLVSTAGTETGAIAGDTPNLAARLQVIASPGEVVIAPSTRRLVGDAFVLQSLGAVHLKGYEREVEVHRVVSPRDVDSRFAALRHSDLGKLVGRLHEKNVLLDLWQSALGGKGQVVLIAGDAGIGKSRLVETLTSEIEKTPHELVRMQCSPHHTASAFHPVAERILRSAGIVSDDTDKTRIAKIEAMLRAAPRMVPDTIQVYSELLSIKLAADRPPIAMTPQDLKEVTIQTIVERMAAMAMGKPVLMVVEDSHWIDPSTQEVLERLASGIAQQPVLLIVTQRPEGASEWVRDFDNATLLSVGLLNRAQTTELVAGILQETPDAALVDDIEARAGGVPLFIEELARSIAEHGPGDTSQTIPETLQGSLMARLDRLSPDAKNVALVASVIGREFNTRLLQNTLGDKAGAFDMHLAELASARIIVASNTAPGLRMFRHALIQDTAYQSLLTRTRRAHHLAIARELERIGDMTEREPEVVAGHFAEAGKPRKAISYWTKAAKRALARSANFEAVTHARAAFALASQIDGEKDRTATAISTGILLGRAFASAGELFEACQVLKDSADKARANHDLESFVDAVVNYSNALFLSSAPVDTSIGLLDEALAWAPAEDEKIRCSLLSTLARVCQMQGDARNAARYTREAIMLVRKLGDKEALCSLLLSEFLTPVSIRDLLEHGSWLSKMDELLVVADQLDDSARGRSRALEVFISAEMGDRERMDSALDKLSGLGATRQHMHLEVIGKQGFAMKSILDGDFAAAEKFASAASDLGRKTHGNAMEGVHGMQMFTIRREQGRLGQIAPVIRRMLDENPEDAAWKPGFAIVASDLGHADAARRMLDEMAATDFAFALDAKYSTTLAYLAEVCAQSADPDLTQRIYDLLNPYQDMTITAGVTTVCLGAAARHLGSLCAAVGEWDRARHHFDAALELNRRMRTPPWIAWTQHDLAWMLLRRGRPADKKRASALCDEIMDAATKFGMVRLTKSCANKLLS